MDAQSPKTTPPAPETLDRLAAAVGEKYAVRDPADMEGYVTEWRDRWPGRAAMVLRPGSTEEVSNILKIANELLDVLFPLSWILGTEPLCVDVVQRGESVSIYRVCIHIDVQVPM